MANNQGRLLNDKRQDATPMLPRARVFVILKNSEAVQGTLCLLERQCGDGLKIDHAGFDVGVAEELLNSLEVVAGHEQMTGKGVAETVR